MLLLEGVEVHVPEDAFKSCLRRHMDWLDELVIDADDNTWLRWMSQRQTKGQRREPHIHLMSEDGNTMYKDANRQKRHFEVQSQMITVDQQVSNAAKRHRTGAAVPGTLPQQRVQQSLSMTASSSNLDTQFQQQRTPLFTRQTSTVEPAPSGCESLRISVPSGMDLKPSVTNVASQQHLNDSQNVVSSMATAPVSCVPSFEQLELFNSATSGANMELKYSEQLSDTNTTDINRLPIQQSHHHLGNGEIIGVKSESIKIEPVEILSGSDNDEDYSTQQIIQQQHDPQPGTSDTVNHTGVRDNMPCVQQPSVRLSGLPSQEVSTEDRLIPMKSSQRREPHIHLMSEDGNTMYKDANRQKRHFEVQSQMITVDQQVSNAAKRHRTGAAVPGTLPQQRVQQSLSMTASSSNLDTQFQQQRTPLFTRQTSTVEPAPSGGESLRISLPSGMDLKPSVTNVASQQHLNDSQNVVSSMASAPVSCVPSFEQLELFNSATSGANMELRYSEQLTDTNTADINRLPIQQSHHHLGNGEIIGVKGEPIKIEPVEVLSGSDDDEDYSTQQIMQQQHDPQPGTSDTLNHSDVENEPLPSVRLSGLPSQEVSAEGRLIPMKSSEHNSEKLTGQKKEPANMELKYSEQLTDTNTADINRLPIQQSHHHLGNGEIIGVKSEPIKIEPVEILSGIDDGRDYSTQQIVQQHDPQPGTSDTVNHTGVRDNMPCEPLPSVRLSSLPSQEVSTEGRLIPMKSSGHNSEKFTGNEPIQTSEKQFKCPKCERCFAQSKSCKQHLEDTHEKPFKCPMCDHHFSKCSKRNKHRKRVHTNEKFKPFKCKFCDKVIECCEKWEPHERKHLGENPFKCRRCEKCFPDVWARKRHVKTVHKKSFKCQFCEKEIKSHEELKKHERLHVHAKLFQCLMCEQRFTHKRSRKFHMKSIHKIDANTINV
ncbi:uncharacterized protein LOC141909519 isoform X2 [Tubulanus polymorphus]|uniref:uncharacterized protein LOC141909519 isoform X2 n=1 Tax=Tubulanus polymorphus TaxID=672921 RepID=UPI003DA496DF